MARAQRRRETTGRAQWRRRQRRRVLVGMIAVAAVTLAGIVAGVTAPQPAAAGTPSAPVAGAGFSHSAVLETDGNVYATGQNAYGAISDGTTTNRPLLVKMLGLPNGVKATKVAVGANHTLVLGDDGKVYGAGRNAYGRLGDNTTTNRTKLVAMQGLPAGVKATQIAAGVFHSVVVADNGKVYATGYNLYGALGDSSVISHSTLVAMQGLPAGVRALQAAAGGYHTVVIADNGKVYACGDNSSGQLGDGTTVANRTTLVAMSNLPAGTTPTVVTAGDRHTVVVTANGGAYATGSNLYGQLATTNTTNANTIAAMQGLPAGVHAVTAAAGTGHSLIVGDNGIAYATGWDSVGQLAPGSGTANRTSLAAMQGLPAGVRAVQASAGDRHSLVVANNGTVYATGWNGAGDLGDGTTLDRSVLAPVTEPCGMREACSVHFGGPGDIPVPADYDGDGRADLAVFRGGTWYIDTNADGTADRQVAFGQAGDRAYAADYNGDHTADLIIFRGSTGSWYVDTNLDGVSDKTIRYASPGDLPYIGDFNTDGKIDPGIFRPSEGNWYVDTNGDGVGDIVEHYASPGDEPAPADYDRNGTVDYAIYRPSNGCFYINDGHFHSGSTGGRPNGYATTTVGFASAGDRMAPADYTGTGKTQLAVFRPGTGTWFLRNADWNTPRGDESTTCR